MFRYRVAPPSRYPPFNLEVAVQDFRRLLVWERAHELVLLVYASTSRVPDRRFPGLVSQLRRASSSIPSNIAEGCSHDTQRELARFLQRALASAHQLHYHLRLAHDLDVLPPTVYAKLDARTEQVQQMLGGLLRKVRGQPRKSACRTPLAVTQTMNGRPPIL